MIEEIVGLSFERIGADGDDRVGKLRILVTIVEFADAHVARCMHLGIVSRAVVDADVLDLHRAEIKLARAAIAALAGVSRTSGKNEWSAWLKLDGAGRVQTFERHE